MPIFFAITPVRMTNSSNRGLPDRSGKRANEKGLRRRRPPARESYTPALGLVFTTDAEAPFMKGGDQDNGIPAEPGRYAVRYPLAFRPSRPPLGMSEGQETNPRRTIRPARCTPFRRV